MTLPLLLPGNVSYLRASPYQAVVIKTAEDLSFAADIMRGSDRWAYDPQREHAARHRRKAIHLASHRERNARLAAASEHNEL